MGNHATLQGKLVSDALIARELAEGSVDDDYTEVDADENEVDEATQTGLERGEHPREDPPVGVKAGAVSVLDRPSDVGPKRT